ncbi:hypothetical protein [Rubritepida flocculans]|uniref:hypothetical protein n=1 Tax=Rubritepida flocculans TaxID=182403 RepID=UPI000489224C|nr:hypothetical protein [Rubritepida flocculans]
MKSDIIVRTGRRTGGAHTDTAILVRANVQRDVRISRAFRESKSKWRGVEVEVSLMPEAILALSKLSVAAAACDGENSPRT